MAGRVLLQETASRFPYWPTKVPPERLLRFYLTRTATRVAAPATLIDLLAVVRSWRPDLIVHDPAEFAAPIAAAWAGTPSINHSWGPLLPTEEYKLAAAAVAPLWTRLGVEPRTPGGMFDHLYLDICPPSLQTPEISDIDPVVGLRPVPVHLRPGRHPERGGSLPAWVDDLPSRPVVYATLGTVFNTPGLLATLAEGLSALDVNVVLAIGLNGDPALFEHHSAKVHVARFVPQSQILPRCDVVVCHGGAGTLLAAMDAGVPVLSLPIGLDQFHNARCCAAAGAGRWLRPSQVAGASVRREIRVLLDDPTYRRRAGIVQAEIRAMPGPHQAVAHLERLADD
ncbi:MAG: glycosyltransferase [Actinomycetota bacterium]|nr:glycosyltransferase [Actinomycetota bacterium]MDQ6947523.1 glycosyltransferase [Actinomycetota bacterium]